MRIRSTLPEKKVKKTRASSRVSVKGPPLVKTTTSACVQFLNLGKCASHAMVTCASVPSSALVMKTVLVQKRVPKVLVDSAVLALIQMPLLVSETMRVRNQ